MSFAPSLRAGPMESRPIFSRSLLRANDHELKESSKCIVHFARLEKKHNIPQDLLHSISIQETGRKHAKLDKRIPWPWSVNSEGKGYYFETKGEAVRFVESQLAKGKKSIDVGCMQINLLYHGDAFASVSEAFDPKVNVEYGAIFLNQKFDQHRSWKKAIANYHSSDYERGNNYQKSVLKIASKIDDHKLDYINKKDFLEAGLVEARTSVKSEGLLRSGKPLYETENNPHFKYLERKGRYKTNMMVYVPRNARRLN